MYRMSPKTISGAGRVVFALLAGIFWLAKADAQPAGPVVESRWLFIFDTAADMKQRLPAVQTELNDLLMTSMGGQMRAGDSIGVWTFDQDLRAGQFPLTRWAPDDAKTIATGLNDFVSRQRYAESTRFSALQPLLNRVIRESDRLTVLIFCDGEDAISGTPYDHGINQVFEQRRAEQKRTRQPFVLVLRTQLGEYVGCTANFPPGMVNFPAFPPFPPPPPPPHTNAPPPPPVPPPKIGPPLIIIGTNVEPSWPPKPKPPLPGNPPPTTAIGAATVTNRPPVKPQSEPPTNPAPVTQNLVVPVPSTNAIAPPPSTPPQIIVSTNAELNRPPEPMPAPRTNVVPAPPTHAATPPENSSSDHRGALALGAGFLIAAIALAALAIVRARKSDRGSLISRSMRKR
jgi:hypothetical protein